LKKLCTACNVHQSEKKGMTDKEHQRKLKQIAKAIEASNEMLCKIGIQVRGAEQQIHVRNKIPRDSAFSGLLMCYSGTYERSRRRKVYSAAQPEPATQGHEIIYVWT
jgi:hypothetical protein